MPRFLVFSLVALFMLMAQNANAHEDNRSFTPREVVEVEKLVKDYLFRNPEIIQELAIAFQEKLQKEEAEALSRQVELNSIEIFYSESDSWLGADDGKFRWVEFYDYQCPWCRQQSAIMEEFLADNDDIRVVLKPFPILENSIELALFDRAFAKLYAERYAELHHQVFSRPQRKDIALMRQIALELGAPVDEINRLMSDEDLVGEVRRSLQFGLSLSFRQTPIIILSDFKVLIGLQSAQQLRDYAEAFRECGKHSCG